MMTDDQSATRRVIGGVDTHKDIHVAVVIDDLGRRLDTASFATTTAGYRDCYRWLGGYGEILAVGVEGTGSWGAGLSRFLRARRERGRGEPHEPSDTAPESQDGHRRRGSGGPCGPGR